MDEHSLHAPFVYHLYKDVIKNDKRKGFESIEALRKDLIANKELLRFEDLGAGSKRKKPIQFKVGEYAKYVLTPPKYSRLLFRLIREFKPNNILELGTAFGVNTLYLSLAAPYTTVYTFEGVQKILNVAERTFEQSTIADNIEIIKGDIDDTLIETLPKIDHVGMVYMDANHSYEPTMYYFNRLEPYMDENSIVVMDDIYWSKGMTKAWNEIRSLPEVTLSLDLYTFGILFFKKELTKSHFVLQY